MSDLKLFSLHAGTAKQLPATSMALEKSLQTLIEKNLEFSLRKPKAPERARLLLEHS